MVVDPGYRDALAGLCLRGIGAADAAAYARLLDLDPAAADLGYPEIA